MRRHDRQVTQSTDIESIILRSDVCRIAFADNNIPYIVTMNFGYTGGEKPCLYFHCAPEGRKIELTDKNNYVCFEMDTDHQIVKGEKGCDWGMKYSSVVGYGRISVIHDLEEKKKGLDSIMSHYTDSGDFDYDERILAGTAVLRLDIEDMTGKKK